MSFTPSNIYTISAGSHLINLAKVPANVTSGSNNWNTSMTDIAFVEAEWTQIPTDTSDTTLICSFTQTSGVIWINNNAAQSGTAFQIIIRRGILT